MPRVKKVVEAEPVVEGLPRPNEPTVVEDVQSDDSIITRVVNKLQRVVIKKPLSDAQQQHLSKLATKKRGKKYEMKPIKEDVEELPVKVKKEKKKIVVIESSESESEPERSFVVKRKVKKVTKKPAVFPDIIQEQIFQSRFRKSLF